MVVILLLGLVLTIFGGSVEVEETRSKGDGQVETIQVQRSKFLNSETLVQIAKNTSFIAIMAIGATFIIVSGGIDLSVGAVYALSAAAGALVLHRFGPGGASPEISAWLGVGAGIGATLAIAVLCGLANGLMVVALKVHPFIITLGTMAIFRGIAFVITDGQSVSQFPRLLRQMVRFEVNRLTIVPLGVMTIMMALGSLIGCRSGVVASSYAPPPARRRPGASG